MISYVSKLDIIAVTVANERTNRLNTRQSTPSPAHRDSQSQTHTQHDITYMYLTYTALVTLSV